MKWPSWGKKSTNPLQDNEINGSHFGFIGAGPSFSFGSASNVYRINSFLQIPEINAIFNLRARAAGNMRIDTVDKDGKHVDIADDDIVKIIDNPNYFQTKEEIFGQTTLFRDIFGDEFIYAQVPYGTKKPRQLFTIPPQAVEMVNTGSSVEQAPFFLLKELPNNLVYAFTDLGGKSYQLDKQYLLHLNDNNVIFNDIRTMYRGVSKLDALQPAVENIKAAYEARNVLIVNRGAIGILSNSSKDGIGGVAPMNKPEKERVQAEFNKYGLTKSKWQVIITNLALSWQQMAIDVDKLKLFEETREDTLKICDSYGTPYEMLSSIRNTTFDNKKEAQRQWYRDTIIPEANVRIAGINRKFDTLSRGYRLIPKFDHLPIFETERKERAQSLMLTVNALTKALEDGAITIEEYKYELKKFGI